MKARKENQRSIKMTAFSTFATALENKRREAGDGSKEKNTFAFFISLKVQELLFIGPK